MGTSRGEVHDLFLMHAEHGMHTRLHKQGQMRIGTQAPVGYEDIPRVQVRMEPDDLGEIMGTLGSRQQVSHHPGARMK